MNREQYQEYLRSPGWRERRNAKVGRSGGKCQICASTKNLEVHHNTYERLGNELDSDLVVLCDVCHEIHHTKRDERTMRIIAKESKPKKQKKPKQENPPVQAGIINTPTFPPGILSTITLTKSLVKSLTGPSGGISHRTLRLLGEPTENNKGWKRRLIGKAVTVDMDAILEEIALAKTRKGNTRSGERKKAQKMIRKMFEENRKRHAMSTETSTGPFNPAPTMPRFVA